MKKLIKFNLVLVSFALLIGLFGACQEPADDIEFPSAENAFTRSDELGKQIEGISRLDGSVDNLIDNSSCLKVVFPVNVEVKGVPTTLNSIGDLAPIQNQYDLNPYDPGFLKIAFPLQVVLSDYTAASIVSQEELNQYASSCQEWGQDHDTECVDFDYPIEIAIYELQNQLASTREIQDDQSLHFILGGLSEEDLISLNFPVTLNAEGVNYVVNDHNELKQVLDNESAVCFENDRRYYPLEELPLGTISLAITDAPFPIGLIEEALVTITRIEVKTGSENDSVPYITLFNDTISYDLLELTNGVTEELSNVQIPEGTYDFFRVYVENGKITLTDGIQFDLKTPSGSSSGLLIKPATSIVVYADQPNDYLFDFDLSRSFVPKGNPNDVSKINGFNFKPVIKAAHKQMTGVLAGTVTNEIDEPLDGVQITLLAADTVNTTAFTGENGTYTLLGLDPGTYVVQAELEGYIAHVSEELQISLGDTTKYNFQIVNE